MIGKWSRATLGLAMLAGLLMVGCGGSGSGLNPSRGMLSQAKIVTLATKAAKLAPKSTNVSETSAKLVANPYSKDKQLNWPAEVWEVSFSGSFPALTACASGTKVCPQATSFDSATVFLNPSSGVVLETTEPAVSQAKTK